MSRRPGPGIAHLRRLFPVVAGGKVAIMIIVEMTMVAVALALSLGAGEAPSSLVKTLMITPAMILVVLCTADVVSNLRSTGELELVVTLAEPGRTLLGRLTPILLVAVVQVLVIALALLLAMAPWQVLLGLLFTPLPLALATAVSLYWNLRLRGAGAVLGASLLCLVPAFVWLAQGEIFVESENMVTMNQVDVAWSFLRCQAGFLLAAICVLALTRRRLVDTQALLDE